MNRQLKMAIAALGIALMSVGPAIADGGDGSSDGGDNSMSQWCGESYAYFHGSDNGPGANGKTTIRLQRSAMKERLLGDFYTAPAEAGGTGVAAPHPESALAVAPTGSWAVGRAFRDDTAA